MTDLHNAPARTGRRPRVQAYTDLDDGRQPPQDLAAEQSVLGGMLLSKDAIADVLERLRPGDFYRPNHQQIYDAILDLFGQGEPADAVTVAAELDRRGLLRRVGGAPYLHTLIATVPTAANAGYYAGIVAEKAVLRRLVEAGTRVCCSPPWMRSTRSPRTEGWPQGCPPGSSNSTKSPPACTAGR